VIQLWRCQRGSSEAIAFLGIIPVMIITITAVLQILAYGFTLVVVESATRDAARAASAGHDLSGVQSVVNQVAAGTAIKMVATLQCPSGGARVTAAVTGHAPRLFESIAPDLFRIQRSVTMPREGNCP